MTTFADSAPSLAINRPPAGKAKLVLLIGDGWQAVEFDADTVPGSLAGVAHVLRLWCLDSGIGPKADVDAYRRIES